MSDPRRIAFRQDPGNLMLIGPTIVIGLGPPDAAAPAIEGIAALVDTGASKCVISPSLAGRLSLPVVSEEVVGRSGGDFVRAPGRAGTLFIRGPNAELRVRLPTIVVQACHPPHEFILGCPAFVSCSLLLRVKTGDIVFQIDD